MVKPATLLLICSLNASAAAADWTHFDNAVERVFALKNKLLGVRSAAALASTACESDRERGRALFARAMEHLKAADPRGAGAGLGVRAFLLESCERCDPLLAQQLAATPGLSAFDTFADDLRRAISEVASDSERAAASALRAAPALPWASDSQRTAFAGMLLKFRRSIADTADGVFADILELLSDEPVDAVPTLFALGNYVLGPFRGDETAIDEQHVRGGATAYVFRAVRPGASDELLMAYLEDAVMALAAQAANSRVEHRLQREMLEQLRPFVARRAAHMRAHFNSIARRLLEEELLLDESALPRRTGSDAYETLASFSEAVNALGDGRPDLAAAIASKMPEGVHKTLVHGGLPGQENAFLFYREAAAADPAVRPGMLLVAAQLLAGDSPEEAMSALRDAVDRLNEVDRTARRSSGRFRFSASGFFQKLGAARFALTVPSMPRPDLREAAAELAPHNPDGVLAIISKVGLEQRRAPALVAWAQALLAKTVRSPTAHRPTPVPSFSPA